MSIAPVPEGTMNKEGEKDENPCRSCRRTRAFVRNQESNEGLLPYRSCDDCNLPLYYKTDDNYVEFDGDIGGIVLISDCFGCDWEAALQRVRLFPKEADTIPEDYNAESALHWACYYRAPVHVIKEIAFASPRMAEIQRGWHEQGLPLDCIFRSHYPDFDTMKTAVTAILEANINAASLSVGNAWAYFEYRFAKRAIEMFPDKFPQDEPFASMEEDEERRKGWQGRWDIFSFLSKVSYYKTTDCSALPLVHALSAVDVFYRDRDGMNWQECPDDTLHFAIRMHPHEVKVPDKDGNLPLHLATQTTKPHREKAEWEKQMDAENEEYDGSRVINPYDDYNKGKVEILVKAYPEAARVKNNDGDLPLHLAIKARKSWEVIEAIFNAYPEAAKEAGKGGNTCLHLAAMSVLPMLEIDLWADPQDPKKFKSHDERTAHEWCYGPPPSHVSSHTVEDFVQLFIEEYPASLEQPNHRGSLPLHSAIKSGNDGEESVQMLFSARPSTVQKIDGETGLYPCMLAAAHCKEDTVVDLTYRLLREWPDAVKIRCPVEECPMETEKREMGVVEANPAKKQKVEGKSE